MLKIMFIGKEFAKSAFGTPLHCLSWIHGRHNNNELWKKSRNHPEGSPVWPVKTELWSVPCILQGVISTLRTARKHCLPCHMPTCACTCRHTGPESALGRWLSRRPPEVPPTWILQGIGGIWLCLHSACRREEINCLRSKEELKYWLSNVCRSWCIYSYLLDALGPLLWLLPFPGIRKQYNFFFTMMLFFLSQTRDSTHVKLSPKWLKMMCKCFTWLLEQPHSPNVCADVHLFLVTAVGFNEVLRELYKLSSVISSDVSLSMSRIDLEVEENFVPSPQLSLKVHLCASKFHCIGSNYFPFVSEGI